MVQDFDRGQMVNSVIFTSEVCSALRLPCPLPSYIIHLGTQRRRKLSDKWPLVRQDVCFSLENSLVGRKFLKQDSLDRPQLLTLHPPLNCGSLSIPCSTRTSLSLKVLYLSFTFIREQSWSFKPSYSYPPEYACVEGINQVRQTLSCETFNISKRFKASIFITCIIENNLSFLLKKKFKCSL